MKNSLFDLLNMLEQCERLGKFEVVESIDKLRTESTTKLANAGWTVTPCISYELMNKLAKIACPSELDATMIHIYESNNYENLTNLVNSTVCSTEHFSNWKEIVDECLECYINGKYLVVLPALLSVVEGSLALKFGTLNTSDVHLKHKVKNEAERNKKRLPTKQNWITLNLVFNELFKKSSFSEAMPDSLNRHWVLHGRSVKVGNEKVAALKLFNMLGTIAMECITLDEVVKIYDDA